MKEVLGKNIQKIRERRGLTQEKIEESLQFPENSMSQIEAGIRLPTTLEFTKLAQLFQVSVADFFIDKETQNTPLTIFYRIALGLDENCKNNEEVDYCLQLCKEGVFLENLLHYPQRQRLLLYAFEYLKTDPWTLCQSEQAFKEERKEKEYLSHLYLDDFEKLPPLQELRSHIGLLVLEAYRQGKISRGRVIELSSLLKLPAKELLSLTNIE